MTAEEKIVLTDEDALRYTQQMRRKLVDSICANDTMPVDHKDRTILLMALDGMDRQALTNKRIAGEATTSEAAKIAAQAITKLCEQIGNVSPFEKKVEGRVIDVPAQYIDGFQAVPGETEIGLTALDYESFKQGMSK